MGFRSLDIRAGTCDAGESCGICLTPIPSSECPLNADLAQCDTVADGELCEGDGECGTVSDLDNCNGGYDVYSKTNRSSRIDAGTCSLPIDLS